MKPAVALSDPQPAGAWALVVIPLFGVLLTITLWTAVLVGLAAGERNALQSELRDTGSYVNGFEQHVQRILREYDRTLRLLKLETERNGKPNPGRLRELGLTKGDETMGFSVTDRAGSVIASDLPISEPLSLGDRGYFERHAKRDSGVMDISHPVVGRIVGKPIVVLSRRLNGPAGEFAGIAMITASPSVFTDYYSDATLGASGIVGVLGLDGAYRARRAGSELQGVSPAADPALLARALTEPSASFVGVSLHDNVERLTAYRRLSDYPIVVVAARSKAEALADFSDHRTAYLALAICGTLVMLPFFGAMTLIMRRLREGKKQLRSQRGFLEELLDNIPIGISVRKLAADGGGDYIVWNETNAVMYGVGKEAALGKPVAAVALPATAERVLNWDRALLASPAILEVVDAEKLPNGTTSHIRRVRAPIFGASDEVAYVVTISDDVTRRKAGEDELRLASKVFETTADGIVISDADDRVVTVNAAFTRLSGYSLDEMIGHPLRTSPFAPLDPEAYAKRMELLHATGCLTAEVRRKHKNGSDLFLWVTASVVRNEAGAINNFVRTFTDISELKSAHRQLEQLANHDPLTQLPNRRLFDDRLECAIGRARRTGATMALLYLDLDGFKTVNDDHGHEVGDQLLKEATMRISKCLRSSDSLCRFGGDEFTLIAENAMGTEHASVVGNRILAALSAPFVISERSFTIGVSIGVAVYPVDGSTARELIGHADDAMYQAKKLGGNRQMFYGKRCDDSGLDSERSATVPVQVRTESVGGARSRAASECRVDGPQLEPSDS
jgi:diguanylate cyclase (GGDEF)-like protein/PAS domain S-box-containing protein